ncbi:MAG: DUF6657 family protein [Spirochaetota bacterium]
MAKIKTALELALEKTESVKSDKESLEAYDHKNEGKKIVSKYLSAPDDPEGDIEKQLKSYSGKNLMYVKEGAFRTLLANLTLPSDESGIGKLQILGKAFDAIMRDKKRAATLVKQLEQFFSQYLQNQEQVRKNLEKQFAPRLRAKEQELAKKLGTEVRLSPASDPEFINYLKKNRAQLEEQYQEALNQVKEEFIRVFEISK